MDIQLVQNVVNLLIMSILSVEDIKRKEIRAFIVIPFIFIGALLAFIEYKLSDIFIIFGFFIVMIIFFFIADKGIGFGDVLTILGLSLWAGIKTMMVIFVFSMGLLWIVSVVWLIMSKVLNKKKAKDIKIAFIPFLFLGLVVSMILEQKF